MGDLISLIVIAFGTIVAIFIPYFKNENNKLKSELKTKDSLINSIKQNESIKSKNSKLSKSELIDKL